MSFRACPKGTREKSCRFATSKDFFTQLRFGRNDTFFDLCKRSTQQCFAQEVDLSLTAKRVVKPVVVRVSESVQQQHGTPQAIRVDNGSGFRSKALDLWAYKTRLSSSSSSLANPRKADRSSRSTGAFEWSVWIKSGLAVCKKSET